MARKRRSYSDEFKQEAVRLVREQGLTAAQVGRDLGVDKSVIRAWLQKADAGELGQEAPPDAAALHAEIRRLRKELSVVKEEREILKKAAAFFAKESQ
jgi:transposase